jgi:hypothetical protein
MTRILLRTTQIAFLRQRDPEVVVLASEGIHKYGRITTLAIYLGDPGLNSLST